MVGIRAAVQRGFNALGYTVMRSATYAELGPGRDTGSQKTPPNCGDLVAFKDWWMSTRPINVPWSDALHFDGGVTCVTLYRVGCWQVQQIVVSPNTVIHEHVHPDVDSFECFLYGDISFSKNGERVTTQQLAAAANFGGQPYYFLATIRILPSDRHSGVIGPRGGVFLSIQKWATGITPTNIGNNWVSDEKARNEPGG